MEYEDRYVNTIQLYYDSRYNFFYDEYGRRVGNIHDYLPPKVVRDFLAKQEYMCVEASPVDVVEIFPDSGLTEEEFEAEIEQMRQEYYYKTGWIHERDIQFPEVDRPIFFGNKEGVFS